MVGSSGKRARVEILDSHKLDEDILRDPSKVMVERLLFLEVSFERDTREWTKRLREQGKPFLLVRKFRGITSSVRKARKFNGGLDLVEPTPGPDAGHIKRRPDVEGMSPLSEQSTQGNTYLLYVREWATSPDSDGYRDGEGARTDDQYLYVVGEG